MTAFKPVVVDISDDYCGASVHLDQISYDDFGAKGTLRPDKVCRLLEAGRVLWGVRALAEDKPYVGGKDRTQFLLVLHYTFCPALWSVRQAYTCPLTVDTRMMDIGRSSVTWRSRLVNKLDHQTLAVLDYKSVFVNRHTRRPAPLPDWLLAKRGSALQDKQPMQQFTDIPGVPTSAYTYDVTVSESDTDRNEHTNQASYVRYCFDASHAAVKEGSLTRLQPSVWLYPLQKLQAFYAKETGMGDKLRVFLWQQENCRDTIRYVIQKETAGQGMVEVFHAAMLFGQQSRL